MIITMKEKRTVVEVDGDEFVVRIMTNSKGERSITSFKVIHRESELKGIISDDVKTRILDIS